MKRIICIFGKLSSILVIAALLLSLVGCDGGYKLYRRDEIEDELFGTVISVSGYEASRSDFDARADMIYESLRHCHKLFDIYNSYEGISNLHTINSLVDGVHPTVVVDQRIIDLLKFGTEMYELTGGECNIAMGSVLSIWHSYRELGRAEPSKAQLPSNEELSEAAEHTDISAIVIDEVASTVHINDPKVTLDVGAIAKGFAVELVAKQLEEMGVSGYLINAGGNVRVIGAKPSGEPFRVGIEDPREDALTPFAKIVTMERGAVVSSGAHERRYFVGGKAYHHIIDKDTLYPAEEGIVQVTVIADSSALADALSTALFAMPVEEGKALAERMGVEAVYIFGA